MKSATLQRRKQDFVRGAIWDAAIDLFAQKGFEQTTIEEIAEAAGVSRRSFFRYFSSKDDLLGQGMVTYGDLLSEAVRECPKNWPLLQVLHKTVLDVAEAAAAQPRTPKIMQVASSSAGAREAQLSRVAEVEERLAQAYAVRCKVGSRKNDVTPGLLASLTLSILDVSFRSWFAHERREISTTIEQVFSTLTHLVCESGRSPAIRKRADARCR